MENRVWAAGSFTVEAAFIVPIVLGVLFAYLFGLFYLHDVAVLSGRTKQAVVLASQGKTDIKTGGSCKKSMQNHLLVMHIKEARLSKGVSNWNCKVKANASWNIPVMNRLFSDRFTYKKTVTMSRVHPESILRIKGKTKEEKDDGQDYTG